MTKSYDRHYFDRWYRHTETRVRSRADLRRRVALVVAIAEEILRRPVRSVLDVGCGEGSWGVELRKLRPAIHYAGIDSSAYAVERFGRARNLHHGRIGDLAKLDLGRESFDLIVCADVLHYVPDAEITAALPALVDRLDGVAYLSAFTREDDPTGDMTGWIARPAAWYRAQFRRAGLVSCGMQCWLSPLVRESASALDLGS
jgi:SAM-dependent methyltransferase